MGRDMVLGLGRLLAVPRTNAFPIRGQRWPSAARAPHPAATLCRHSGETRLSCDLVTSACGRKRCHGGGGLRYASSLPWSGVAAAGGRLSWTARSHSFFTVM